MSAGAGRSPDIPEIYRAALYMRLSKDDEGTAESASVAAQRKMLRAYAGEHGYLISGEYIDDGYSGTNFDRPQFKQMIADIEARKINMVLTKDFSRLGRDYISAGRYTELYFPERGVRYIAVNDGYDSVDQLNDIAPFKHVVNEMYARDASKKIRSAFQTKMLEGSYIGNFAPYGYQKDLQNKNRLVADCESAPVVREIFQIAADGSRPSEIAAYLNQKGIASPALYRCKTRPHLNPDNYTSRGEWTSSTICKMLSNVVYLGHTAQGKTSKPSFKSRTALRKPRDEWYVVENTHEPLISKDLFDLVRKRSVSRRQPPKTGFINVFSGAAKCAACGSGMSTSGSKGSAYKLVCGRYKLYGGGECTNHFISYELLYQAVLSEVREMLTLSERERGQALAGIERASRNKKEDDSGNESIKLMKKMENRDKELDNLIRRSYEDNVSGKISGERFAKLSAAYESEQRELAGKLQMLVKTSVRDGGGGDGSIMLLRERLDGLADIRELTPGLIKRLIERIEIEQGVYEKTPEGKKKRQVVRIFWSFAGEINP